MLNESILLVLPLRAYSVNGAIFIDEQACRGLSKWLDNFPAVVLACPTTSSEQIPPATASIALLLADGKLEFHPLPCAYSPPAFVRHLATTAWKLRRLVKSSRHLQFAIGGFWGDWGSVASALAATLQRPYAVWTDRVESEVIRFQSQSKRGLRRAAGLLNVWLTQILERAVIRRAGVGLFHGMDCYTAYARYSRNPHLVDDIHFGKDSHISEQELSRRFAANGPLHFIYAGRAHRDKGIYDWIEVFSRLAMQGRHFRATWFGDGPELKEARAMLSEKSLGATIGMPGAISHVEMLQAMKSADAFVFCHKTQESPRCLIEALACGLPLVGYHSEYASHLISQNIGGLLSASNDIVSLTATVTELFDRDRLQQLSKRAARDGLQFTADSVFEHRSNLIKNLRVVSKESGRRPEVKESILLVLPLRAYSVNGTIFIDEQACRGLSKWLDNFPAVVLACPTTSSEQIPPATVPIAPLLKDGRLEFHPLPCAYSPQGFVRHLATTALKLYGLIQSSRYLQFAIGGFWGDWGAVASVLAATLQRPYAVWTDRVESEVIRFQSQSKRGLLRWSTLLTVRLTQLLERAVIRRAGVGLFHGMDCYTAYARYSRNPHLVDNIHFGKESHISEQELSLRLAGNGPLHFIYAGRAHQDKGIHDWIEVFSRLAIEGQDFQATWFGDGPELEKARSMVTEKSLGKKIKMPGAIPHMELLQVMRSADAFVFCHKTQESPRCLIEALACGLPLIGYHSEYASHLISQNSGGRLSAPNDIASLTTTMVDLFDRARIRELSKRAARDGLKFTSDSVFEHRSNLIKSLFLAP